MMFYILYIFIKNYFSKDQSLIKEKDEYKSKGCDEINDLNKILLNLCDEKIIRTK